MRADVEKMLENEGLYLAADPFHPDAVVPIVSRGGKLFSMKIGRELWPQRFLERATLHGPVEANESNRLVCEENEPNGLG